MFTGNRYRKNNLTVEQERSETTGHHKQAPRSNDDDFQDGQREITFRQTPHGAKPTMGIPQMGDDFLITIEESRRMYYWGKDNLHSSSQLKQGNISEFQMEDKGTKQMLEDLRNKFSTNDLQVTRNEIGRFDVYQNEINKQLGNESERLHSSSNIRSTTLSDQGVSYPSHSIRNVNLPLPVGSRQQRKTLQDEVEDMLDGRPYVRGITHVLDLEGPLTKEQLRAREDGIPLMEKLSRAFERFEREEERKRLPLIETVQQNDYFTSSQKTGARKNGQMSSSPGDTSQSSIPWGSRDACKNSQQDLEETSGDEDPDISRESIQNRNDDNVISQETPLTQEDVVWNNDEALLSDKESQKKQDQNTRSTSTSGSKKGLIWDRPMRETSSLAGYQEKTPFSFIA